MTISNTMRLYSVVFMEGKNSLPKERENVLVCKFFQCYLIEHFSLHAYSGLWLCKCLSEP